MSDEQENSASMETRLAALRRSDFRARFSLGPKERLLVRERGLSTVAMHARELLRERLADAAPVNDGRQTPMRGHPVFIAQHATATCCRSCLAKWHGVPKGRAMTDAEVDLAAAVVVAWVEQAMASAEPGDEEPVQGWLF